MQNPQTAISNLFNQENIAQAKKIAKDYKKPILLTIATILVILIALQWYKMLSKEPTAFDILVEKQQNNLIIIGDQLEIQKDLRSERNDLQAKIDALNVKINSSKDVVTQAETANSQIKEEMLKLANPLPTNIWDNVK